MSILLETKNLGISFGGLKAVDGLNLSLTQGQITGLIGPNGAGKTTCFNMITGVYQPTSGSILFDGKELRGHKNHHISSLGIARTFQNIRLFKSMSVLDHVKVALHQSTHVNLFQALFRTPGFFKEEKRVASQALELLRYFSLDSKKDHRADSLPYGEQRKLEIVRALATKPKLLLLDEPAAGMNPQETAKLTELIHKVLKDFQTTVLLIEHDMSLVMKICQQIFVLDYGKEIARGTPQDVRTDKAVIKAYLGED